MDRQAAFFENNWYYVTETGAINNLRLHGNSIDYLIPFWFGVTERGTLADQADQETLEIIKQLGLPVLAIVHNYSSRQYGPLIHRLLTSVGLRQVLIENIVRTMTGYGFQGVNIDFEFVPPEDRYFMTNFMAELYQALKPYGLLVTISVPPQLRDDPNHPFSGAFSYPDLAWYSDQVYVLAYDEHVAEPGPIASIGFVRDVLGYAISVIPRKKIRLGMAVYGRDWSTRTELPVELSYEEAVATAERHGAAIRFDEEAKESTYNYTENGVAHTVWFEEVQSFAARLNLALREDIPGIGVWRLGLEDPRIWQLLRGI